VGDGLSVVPLNQWEDEDRARRASRSSSLLRLEVSWARVFQFCLKTGDGATMGGACGIIVEVMWM
jgi:hypothetical protein